MFGIYFIYKSQENIIQYGKSTIIKTAFEEYANKISLEIENLIFFHNDIRVNLNMKISIEQLFGVENQKNKIENNKEPILEVLVFDKNNIKDEENDILNEEEEKILEKLETIEINFIYKKTDNIINCSPNSSLKDICEQFSDNRSLDMKYLMFIYNDTLLDIKEDISIIN